MFVFDGGAPKLWKNFLLLKLAKQKIGWYFDLMVAMTADCWTMKIMIQF